MPWVDYRVLWCKVHTMLRNTVHIFLSMIILSITDYRLQNGPSKGAPVNTGGYGNCKLDTAKVASRKLYTCWAVSGKPCEIYIGKTLRHACGTTVHHRGGKAIDTIEPYSNEQPLTRFTRGDNHANHIKIKPVNSVRAFLRALCLVNSSG
jgi:hypothetical protein